MYVQVLIYEAFQFSILYSVEIILWILAIAIVVL